MEKKLREYPEPFPSQEEGFLLNPLAFEKQRHRGRRKKIARHVWCTGVIVSMCHLY